MMGVALNLLSKPPVQQVTMPIYWQDPAGVGPDAIRRYFSAIQAVYNPIQIEASPMPQGSQPVDGRHLQVVFAGSPPTPRLATDDAYGVALPGRAYIYTGALGGFGDERDAATEAVLAHEIGHMVGLQHTLAGTMQPVITQQGLLRGMQPLSKGQLKRAGISLMDLAK